MVSRRLPRHQAPRDANIHNLHLNLAVPARGANITTPDRRRVRRGLRIERRYSDESHVAHC